MHIWQLIKFKACTLYYSKITQQKQKSHGVKSLWHTTQRSYHVMQPQLHYLHTDLNFVLTMHTLSYQERCASSVLQ